MLKGVVFDFDGVIVDSHVVHMRAWKKFLESVGQDASEEQLQFVLDGRKRDDILRYFLGNLDSRKALEYGHQKEQIFRTEAADVQPVEGLVPFLEQLKSAQLLLGVASSGSKGRVRFLLDRLGLTDCFEVIVTGDEVENGKPDPALFLKAAQGLNAEPAELIAFEDAVSGVKAATGAGIRCVGIAPANRAPLLQDAGAAYVVRDFRNLSHDKLQRVFLHWQSPKVVGDLLVLSAARS